MITNLELSQDFSSIIWPLFSSFLFFEQIGLLPWGVLEIQQLRESKELNILCKSIVKDNYENTNLLL